MNCYIHILNNQIELKFKQIAPAVLAKAVGCHHSQVGKVMPELRQRLRSEGLITQYEPKPAFILLGESNRRRNDSKNQLGIKQDISGRLNDTPSSRVLATCSPH